MPDQSPPAPDEPVPPAPALTPAEQDEQEQDAGDFITRHVLEKDSVFFEG